MLVRAAVHKFAWTRNSNQVWADMFYLSAYMFLRHKKKGKLKEVVLSFVCHRLKRYPQPDTVAQMTCDNLHIIPTELKTKFHLTDLKTPVGTLRYSDSV